MFEQIMNNSVLKRIFSMDNLVHLVISVAFILAGFILVRIIVMLLKRMASKRISGQTLMVFSKIITYLVMTVVIILVLSEWGVNTTALLGAAGVVGIALGVASQKSIGNMVSGLFLISEKSFEVGDVVKIDNTTGIVMDIDLLAFKVRTFDNQMVRIPNEVLVSSIVTNITRFPLRRMDFNFTVPYGTDLNQLEEILRQSASVNPQVLEEPEPLFLLKDYGKNGVDALFGVWFLKAEYISTKNSIFKQILKGFEENGITIPAMRVSIHDKGSEETQAAP